MFNIFTDTQGLLNEDIHNEKEYVKWVRKWKRRYHQVVALIYGQKFMMEVIRSARRERFALENKDLKPNRIPREVNMMTDGTSAERCAQSLKDSYGNLAADMCDCRLLNKLLYHNDFDLDKAGKLHIKNTIRDIAEIDARRSARLERKKNRIPPTAEERAKKKAEWLAAHPQPVLH